MAYPFLSRMGTPHMPHPPFNHGILQYTTKYYLLEQRSWHSNKGGRGTMSYLLNYTTLPATMAEVAHPSLPRRWITIIYYVQQSFTILLRRWRWHPHPFQDVGFGTPNSLYFNSVLYYNMLRALLQWWRWHPISFQKGGCGSPSHSLTTHV